MTPHEYQHECRRTWTNRPIDDDDARKQHAALGLASETGELAGLVIKSMHYGQSVDVDEVASELGDALWYLTMLADEYGLTLEYVMDANIAKLRKRHPDGFSDAKYTNGKPSKLAMLEPSPPNGDRPGCVVVRY